MQKQFICYLLLFQNAVNFAGNTNFTKNYIYICNVLQINFVTKTTDWRKKAFTTLSSSIQVYKTANQNKNQNKLIYKETKILKTKILIKKKHL